MVNILFPLHTFSFEKNLLLNTKNLSFEDMTTEQKVSTVANNDSAVNTEIETQAPYGWFVANLILSGANMVILFSRIVTTEI